MQKGQEAIIYMTIKTMNKCESDEHIVDYMMNMQKSDNVYKKNKENEAFPLLIKKLTGE